MKKVLIIFLLLFSVFYVQAIDLPNLEITSLLDLNTEPVDKLIGFTSKIFSFKDIDLRVGYCNRRDFIGSIGFDLIKLEKLNANINYAWEELLKIDVGIWCGYNFKTKRYSYGVLGVVLQINF